MTLEFLCKAFRTAFTKSAAPSPDERNAQRLEGKTHDPTKPFPPRANQSLDDANTTFADEAIDPFNPFPDPVVIAFRDVLDLHSIPPRQVRAVVEEYLEEAHRRGFRYLRIIHGKGVGVQREMIRSLLSRTPFVVDYRDAPVEAGGWGATLVTLEVEKK
ncbi:MAG: Smr/MutS family protein [Acidobacteria bacterium]|nr:Smr/MutS family protein [Acidobacteriota bacterium]